MIDFWLVSNYSDGNNIFANVMATFLTDHKTILIQINIYPNINCNKYKSYLENE